MSGKKNILLGFVSIFIFFCLGLCITYPLIFHMGNLAVGLGDELVISWIQNWVIHSLFTNPLHIFEANLYFPYHNTLAYSDLFLTSSLLSIIPLKFIGQPIVVHNFTLISSLILLGFSIYLLSFYLTKDFLLSVFAGVLVIFSPAVLDKATHLQILAIFWVPLSILLFLIFIKSKKSKYFVISLLFFLAQVYNSFMPGYFILFSYVIIIVYYWLYNRVQIKKIFVKKNIFLFIISLILIIPIAIPYYQVSKEFNYVRDMRDAIHFAIQPEDLFYPSNHTRLKNYLFELPFNKTSQNGEFKPGYLGFIFTLLTGLVLVYLITNFKKKNLFINAFSSIGLLGFILSLGPALHLGRQTVHWPFPIPLPYLLFYYVIPGFKGFRNSARWEMLFILCMAIVIALVLQKILKKYSIRTRSIIYIILIIGCVLEFNFPMKFVNVPQKSEFPKVFDWLNETPQSAKVIIMPAYNWNMFYSGDEIMRDYYSTSNFRRTVNGYTGFSPPPWQDLLVNLQNNFPNQESVNLLKKLGINYIVIDKKGYDKSFKDKQLKIDGQTVVNDLKNNTSFGIVKEFGDFTLFSFIK